MGSQTLEILRQGFWASFTGGWFFDPHQEIFCNTFHLYLWMYFVLLPFVIFLTTDSSTISLIVYPCAIFATFTLLKAINYHLHKVFDTGEIKEEIEVGEKTADLTSDSGAAVKVGSTGEVEANESIEMKVFKEASIPDSLNVEANSVAAAELSEPSTPTISHTEVDEAITITVDGKSDNNDTESDNSLKEENGQPEIVVVDVHKDTTSFGKTDDKQLKQHTHETGQESPLSSNSENMLPPLQSETPVHASDAVIANQGVISDVKLKLYSNDSLALARPPSPSPLCLRRLIDTSSDSSWSSSTGSSANIFEDAKESTAVPNVPSEETSDLKDDSMADVSSVNTSVTSGTLLLDKLDTHFNNLSTNLENFKSENVLSATAKEDPDSAAAAKAVSLSALQSKGEGSAEPTVADKFAGTGARPKTSHVVWFSLPEMEKSTEDMNSPNKKDEQCSAEAISGESSDYEIAVKLPESRAEGETTLDPSEDDAKSECQKKSDGDSDTTPDLKSELLGSLDRRAIRRRGAVRPSTVVQRERASLRARRQRTTSDSGGFPLLSAEDELCNALPQSSKHLALSHDDTSAGAVHCFQDEYGQWHTYMFGDEQLEVQPSTTPVTDPAIYPSSLIQDVRLRDLLRNSRRGRQDSTTPSIMDNDLEFERMCSEIQEFRRSHFQPSDIVSLPNSESIQSQSAGILKIQNPEETVKHHYKVPIVGRFTLKIGFDRLFLLALLDRDKSGPQTMASVILATLTAALGYNLLSRQYVFDFWVFVLCFVIAKCQFSLLKSVQPDSASPIHGHNNIITFSRAIYFCIVSSIILMLDEIIRLNPTSPKVYGVQLYSEESLEFARDLLIGFLLAFPVIFLFGLLPQITTFTMYALEQVDVHLFGGTAMTGLPASLYAIFRSIISVAFLYGFAFISLQNESKGQHVLFSVFCGLLVAVSYHLSRCSSDPSVLWGLCKDRLVAKKDSDEEEEEVHDPLPEKLASTVQARICHDLIACFGIVVVVFAVHVSTAFTVLQPSLSYVLYIVTGTVGILNHYVFPQLRKQLPWSILAIPIFKSAEYHLFEARGPAKIMWFEQVYVWLFFVEKNILYPVTFLSALTTAASDLTNKFGDHFGPFVITICGLKLLRQSFSNTPRQYLILIWTVLFFHYDFKGASETMPIDYFIMSIFVDKALDLYLKFCFIFTYTAPWQITWGSAFHAFAQPFSVPHCGMLFLQAVVSAFFSAPLNPFLGSAIFITSYVRPIKFWEKNYNTKRVDHSNTRLSTHLDSNPGLDDNNLNSIFYEHLTRSLQHSLCGDLMLGRWGSVASGDCFVMASDYLNALVHIIEVGNGLVTFQLRGLEFRGTYCQQREVEAITESVEDDRECCCFDPGHLPNMLSFNMTFNLRWLAWEVVQSKYILEGYSISDNTATSMFQVFDLRKIFITYYVKAIIFYTIKSSKLSVWLNDDTLMVQLSEMRKSNFVDLDATFRPMTDEDYDIRVGGVSRGSFCSTYLSWVEYCNQSRKTKIDEDGETSNLVTLCFALSLLGRRLFSTASHQQTATLKSFLYGLHALFKGDFRVTSAKDEWVFAEPDMELLRKVIAPAVRMSVKLHQDHFTSPDEYDDNLALYRSISNHEKDLVISHEGHPIWRQAVLNNKPSLLALRYVMDEGTDDYKIIMLNKRQLSFRVVKVNRECVRGLWAGQLQELIFLRNRNPERGSIQNAKQALRNMINSSLDQPIGYPIYVSPLTTSYADTNTQFTNIIGGPFSSRGIRKLLSSLFQRLRERYGHTCHSGSGYPNSDGESPGGVAATPPERATPGSGAARAPKAPTSHLQRGSSIGATYSAVPSTSRRSSTSTSGGVLTCTLPAPAVGPISENILRARIKDISQVLDSVNVRNAVELEWPSDDIIEKSGKTGWGHWYPYEGLEGVIVHRWEPNHANPVKRSHLDRTLYLLKVEERYIPVVESGIQILNEVEV